MPKETRSISTDDGKFTITITDNNDTITIRLMDKEFKTVWHTLNKKDFLDTIVAAWPESVAYQFKDGE